MSGRVVMAGLLIFTAVFAVALWYAQFYAFYSEYTTDVVDVQGSRVSVTDFAGVDATTSPLKMRACFRLDTVPEAPLYPRAEPLVAPGWFDCFDAEALSRDLAAGRAVAYLAAESDFDGIDRVIARYPDGRAFMWRQLNAAFAEQ